MVPRDWQYQVAFFDNLLVRDLTFDAMRGRISPSERSLSAREDESEVTVSLLLHRGTNDPSLEVSVDYQTADDTAKAGEDYVATSGTVTFAPGETNKQVMVQLLNDTMAEPEEQFSLVLSSPSGSVSLSRSNVVIRIQDDDQATRYVWLDSPNPARLIRTGPPRHTASKTRWTRRWRATPCG